MDLNPINGMSSGIIPSHTFALSFLQGWALRSFPFGTFRSLKGMFRSFFEFLATCETQKIVPFFSVLC